ncbi:MAG: hypothetical protein AW07_03931 [Candidatus Accumulibacter sp. SK-11]|nr:MAG: hypothetical protein AW07_03931 [Candidatus Accumulibacter sp. SK-11]
MPACSAAGYRDVPPPGVAAAAEPVIGLVRSGIVAASALLRSTML